MSSVEGIPTTVDLCIKSNASNQIKSKEIKERHPPGGRWRCVQYQVKVWIPLYGDVQVDMFGYEVVTAGGGDPRTSISDGEEFLELVGNCYSDTNDGLLARSVLPPTPCRFYNTTRGAKCPRDSRAFLTHYYGDDALTYAADHASTYFWNSFSPRGIARRVRRVFRMATSRARGIVVGGGANLLLFLLLALFLLVTTARGARLRATCNVCHHSRSRETIHVL